MFCFQVERSQSWQVVAAPRELITVLPTILDTSLTNASGPSPVYHIQTRVAGVACSDFLQLIAFNESCSSLSRESQGDEATILTTSCTVDAATSDSVISASYFPTSIGNKSLCLNSPGIVAFTSVAVIDVQPLVENASLDSKTHSVGGVAQFHIAGLGIHPEQFYVVSGSNCTTVNKTSVKLVNLTQVTSALTQLFVESVLTMPRQNSLCHGGTLGREPQNVLIFNVDGIIALGYAPSDFSKVQFPFGGDIIISLLGDKAIDNDLDSVFLQRGDLGCNSSFLSSRLWLEPTTSSKVTYELRRIQVNGSFSVCFEARNSQPQQLFPLLYVSSTFARGFPLTVAALHEFRFSVFGIGVNTGSDVGYFVPIGTSCDQSAAVPMISHDPRDDPTVVVGVIARRGIYSLCWKLSTGTVLSMSTGDVVVVPETPSGVSLPVLRAFSNAAEVLLGNSSAINLITPQFPDAILVCPNSSTTDIVPSIFPVGLSTFNFSAPSVGLFELCFRSGLESGKLTAFANVTVLAGISNSSLSSRVVEVGGIITISVTGSGLDTSSLYVSDCNGKILDAPVIFSSPLSIAWHVSFSQPGLYRLCSMFDAQSDPYFLGGVIVDPSIVSGVSPSRIRAGQTQNITLLDRNSSNVRVLKGIVDCSSIGNETRLGVTAGSFSIMLLDRGDYTVCAELLARNASVGVLNVVGYADSFALRTPSELPYVDFDFTILVNGAGLQGSDIYFLVPAQVDCNPNLLLFDNSSRVGIIGSTWRKVELQVTANIQGIFHLCANVDNQGFQRVPGAEILVSPTLVLDQATHRVFLQGPAAISLAAATYSFRFTVVGGEIPLSVAKVVDTTAFDEPTSVPSLSLSAMPVGQLVIRAEVFVGIVRTAVHTAQILTDFGALNYCEMPDNVSVVGTTASHRREFAFGLIELHNSLEAECSNVSALTVLSELINFVSVAELVTDPLLVFSTISGALQNFSSSPSFGIVALQNLLSNLIPTIPAVFTSADFEAHTILAVSAYEILKNHIGIDDQVLAQKTALLLYDEFSLLIQRSCESDLNYSLASSGVHLKTANSHSSITLADGVGTQPGIVPTVPTSGCNALLSLSQNILPQTRPAGLSRFFSTESDSTYEVPHFDTSVVTIFGSSESVSFPIRRSCDGLIASVSGFSRTEWISLSFASQCADGHLRINIPLNSVSRSQITIAVSLSTVPSGSHINLPLLIAGCLFVMVQLTLIWNQKQWMNSKPLLFAHGYFSLRLNSASIWAIGELNSRLGIAVAISIVLYFRCAGSDGYVQLLVCAGLGTITATSITSLFGCLVFTRKLLSLLFLISFSVFSVMIYYCVIWWAYVVHFVVVSSLALISSRLQGDGDSHKKNFLVFFGFGLRVAVSLAAGSVAIVAAVIGSFQTISSLVLLALVIVCDFSVETSRFFGSKLLKLSKEHQIHSKIQPPTLREPLASTSPDDETDDEFFVSFNSDSEITSQDSKFPPIRQTDQPEKEKVVFVSDGESSDVDDFVLVDFPEKEPERTIDEADDPSAVEFEDVDPDLISSDSDFDEVEAVHEPIFSNPTSLAWEGRAVSHQQFISSFQAGSQAQTQNPLEDFLPSRRPY